jgi:hypothetical protein
MFDKWMMDRKRFANLIMAWLAFYLPSLCLPDLWLPLSNIVASSRLPNISLCLPFPLKHISGSQDLLFFANINKNIVLGET